MNKHIMIFQFVITMTLCKSILSYHAPLQIIPPKFSRTRRMISLLSSSLGEDENIERERIQDFVSNSSKKGLSPLFETRLPTSQSKPERFISRRSSLLPLQSSTPSVTSDENLSKRSVKQNLSKMASIASLLCVLDCTVLPIVTVLFPLFGLGSASQAALWHEIGHRVALFFVLPVGGLAAVSNIFSRPKKGFTKYNISAALAFLGLTFVYAANGGHHAPFLSLLPPGVFCKLHCGTMIHRVTNIAGCGLMLGSNYVCRKISGCAVGTSGGASGTRFCCSVHAFYGMEGEEGKEENVFFSW